MTQKKRNQVNVEKSCTVKIPNDGTSIEIPVPKGLKLFFSEDGKLMARLAVEDKHKHECKAIEYDDIAKKLFLGKKAYFTNGCEIEKIQKMDLQAASDYDNCTSEKQAKRFLAFNKLQNIAKYLNRGWKPNFCNHTCYTIARDEYTSKIESVFFSVKNPGAVVFKDEKTAEEAIRIMGKESLNDLFATDW